MDLRDCASRLGLGGQACAGVGVALVVVVVEGGHTARQDADALPHLIRLLLLEASVGTIAKLHGCMD
jgi:hypothetical protein